MDDHLKRRVLEMATTLAAEEKERLEAAGTFVDLERLTMEIGDELARQLTQLQLSSRARETVRQELHVCPECGRECPIEELEPLILQGMRGDVEYSEPKCHCPRCRRDFFPAGEGAAASAP